MTIFVDHFTSLIATYFQRTKALQDAIPVRERYIADHAVYGRVKRFHSDSAGELMGQTMQQAMHQHQCGVTHNVAGESDMNNRAEAAINLIFTMARAMRLHSGVPQSHWPVIALYATYVRNRLPLRSKKDGTYTTRLTLARGDRHTVAELRVFGCICHGLIQKKDRDSKLSAIARTGVFMGFPRYQHGGAAYIWLPNDSQRRYITVYSVRFDEGRTYKDTWKLTPEMDDTEEGSMRRLLLHQQESREEEAKTEPEDETPGGHDVIPLLPPPRPGKPRTPRSQREAQSSSQSHDVKGDGEGDASGDELPLPKGACGKVDPKEPKLPTWTTQGRCRLPNGHLGSCDWEREHEATHDAMFDDELDRTPHHGVDYDFHMAQAGEGACHWSQRVRAHRQPLALLLFSGECHDESLAAHMRMLGWQVMAYDQKIGGRGHDLTNAEVINKLESSISNGLIDYVYASPPCKSFSIAAANSRPQLRSKTHPEGLPDIPSDWIRYIQRHNSMAQSTVHLIKAAHRAHTAWGVENPADRGDENSPAHWEAYAHHGTLWDFLKKQGISQRNDGQIKAYEHTIPMCAFGTAHQKYTTIWCSAPLEDSRFHTRKCHHNIHTERLRGNHQDGTPKTHHAETYPPAMAVALASAITHSTLKNQVVHATPEDQREHQENEHQEKEEIDELAYLTRTTRAKSRRPRSKPCVVDDILRYIPVPTSYREVLQHEFRDQIIDSMIVEFEAHLRNKTWTRLVPRTSDMNVVGSTWAWDIKRDADKKLLKFKSRFCAQGFTQVKGTDYFRKYSHAMSLTTYRLFLATCASNGLKVTEADYTTAYLNAKLDTEIYLRQAEGFEERDKDGRLLRGPDDQELVYELDKAIYGLVQSGLMWEEEHWSTLKNEGWEQSPGEPTLFKKKVNGVTCYLCTYVDNLFMGFPEGAQGRETLLHQLGKRYKINDLGEVRYSLGICVRQDTAFRAVVVHQQPLIEEIARNYEQDISRLPNSARCTPYGTRAYEDLLLLDPTSTESLTWQRKCLQLAGKINYVAVGTRPDVAGALSMTMQHVSRASADIYEALLHIARYLQATSNYAIHYNPQTPHAFAQNAIEHCRQINSLTIWEQGEPSLFCDASQGGPKPMMCAMMFIAGAPLAWKMGKLTATTLSSTEAEWFAQTAGATILQNITPTLGFLGAAPGKAVLSFCDNKSAVLIAEADLSTKRMKHVITRMAYLQERIQESLLTIVHIDKEGMLADIGTKRLSPAAFHRLRAFLVRPHGDKLRAGEADSSE